MCELECKTPLQRLEQRYIRAMLKRVVEAAPHFSTCKGRVERNAGGEFSVAVNVSSEVGPFEATGHSDDFREAVDLAESRVRKQLEEWQKMRAHDQWLDTYRSSA